MAERFPCLGSLSKTFMHSEEPMDYEICLPIIDDLEGYKELIYITPSSEDNQKEALEKMASYFKRELHYDHLQYSKEDHNDNCIGILIAEKANDIVKNYDHRPNRIIGGACFGKKSSGEYFLDWVWFHPFARNRKKLSRIWPELRQKFGQFTVTKPLSAHMAKFLDKHAYKTLKREQ